MALIACWECGNQISTEATSCPKCGAPRKEQVPASTPVRMPGVRVAEKAQPSTGQLVTPKKPDAGRTLGFGLMIAAAVLIFLIAGLSTGRPSSSPAPAALDTGTSVPPKPLTENEKRQADSVAKATEANAVANRIAGMKNYGECGASTAKIKASMNKHPDWNDEVIGAIVCGKVHIGMTAAQARAGWGAPSSINRSTYSFGVHEQWVYGEYGGSGYLYFEDGVLTSMQTAR